MSARNDPVLVRVHCCPICIQCEIFEKFLVCTVNQKLTAFHYKELSDSNGARNYEDLT